MFQLRPIPIPHPSRKQIIFGSLGSSIGVLGILVTVALAIVETIIHPKRRRPLDLYALSPYELDLPAEAVVFPPLHGDYRVCGWYISHPGATSIIINCPGYRSRAADVLGMGAHLWRTGHSILVFEYYGHGISIGPAVTLGYCEVNDFLGAVAYAKERDPQTRLGVLAYSMGAAVAIRGSAWNKDIEALVADSAFATQRSVVDYNVRHVVRLPTTPFLVGSSWFSTLYHTSEADNVPHLTCTSPVPYAW